MRTSRKDQLSILKRLELKEFPQPEVVLLKNPVLLCHGFGAIASIVSPAPMHDVCMDLRSHGIVAFAPNVVPYAGIATRAERWADILDQLTKALNCTKMNVIAHSMGGLDMRYAISKLGASEKVESLITIATPHRGSYLADFVLRAPDTVTEKLGGLFDWFGNAVFPYTKSDVLSSLEQLTRNYVCTEFNPSTPNVESVSYYSYSAAVGKGTKTGLNPIFMFQNHQIYEEEGLNDSFVSVESAKWENHIETIPLSHLDQIKLRISKDGTKLYKNFWLSLVQKLAEEGH